MFLGCSMVEAGMENVRFALEYKPTYVYSKAIPYLCDNPATVTEEPNYSPNFTNTPCTSYSVSCQPFGPGEVYIVLGHAGSEGVGAASFGISYGGSSGVGIDPQWVTWTPCADGLSFPSSDGVHGLFPQPGGGLRITWDISTSCQREVIGNAGVHVVVGVFYVYAYSSDVLRITPNNNVNPDGELAVADCAGHTTDFVQIWGPTLAPQLAGQMGFNEYGYNPCFNEPCLIPPCTQAPCTTPIRPTTWGRLKATYRDDR
jgi:hypothetical protein